MPSIESSAPTGSGISQLVQVMRAIGHNDFDRFEIATVTSAPPVLTLRINGMKFDLDASDLVVAEHLLEHKRTVSLSGGSDVEMTVRAALQPGDRVIVASMNGGQSYVVIDRAVVS